MPIRFRTTLLAAALAAPLLAQAWGFEGHRLIASLAQAQLSPAARATVARLLALEPGATMSSVSTWADEQRDKKTARWHYVNIGGDDCNYQPARDCEGGACVVESLSRQVAILESDASDAEKLVALKWVIHLTGDVHQPLHAGHAEDRGGNSVQLQAFGRGSNLHSLWDTGLIMNREGGPAALRGTLQPQLQDEAPALKPTASAWAMESCKIVNEVGFYPQGREIGAAYQSAHEGELEARLKLAARRLAGVLNGALAAAS
ncbi:MAG TPA: S1/P1 nuclease [Burkholderiaceae bacterium]